MVTYREGILLRIPVDATILSQKQPMIHKGKERDALNIST